MKQQMEIRHKHIGWWLCSMLMLLCWSCGGQDTDTDTPDVDQGPFLEIKVYSPERSQVTRADIGDVPGDTDENTIHHMNIWVFENHGTGQPDDGKFVGYLSVANPNPLVDSPYRILVSETFVDNPPAVDIYVTANVTESNTGIKLDRTTTRDQLDAALIGQNYFGLSSPVKVVPTDSLPMSGVLKNQPVVGIAPIVSVVTNVKVARAVSKVRFVFCNSSDAVDQKLTIQSITFDDEMIPKEEYLFLNAPYTGRNFKVGSEYEAAAPLVNTPTVVASYSSPTEYAYRGQTGEEYEALINKGIKEEILTEVGKFYLRESDKKITGTITYTVGSSTTALSAPFTMSEAGDFSRNHTWIVYGFFAGKDNLKVFSVDVNDWTKSSGDHEVYNW
jgi:hypothetical protein